MDIPRDPKPRKRRRIIIGSLVVLGLVLVTGAIRRLPSAAPTVDRATAWMDTVQRGTLVRQVRGPGTLVPEQMRWITAVTAGRIEQILLLPGSEVQVGDSIMRMSNPDVDMQLLEAQQQLSQARASLVQLESSLRTQELTQEGAAAQLRTQLLDAQRVYETNKTLFETNPDLVARAELDRTREQVEELTRRLELEEEGLEVLRTSAGDQIQAQEDQVERLVALAAFNRSRLESMVVQAGVAGVLAPLEVTLQEGQWVQSGQQLGRVMVPGRLKAEIRIPQTQAQDVVVGQAALIDTRTDTIEGRVVRIDPAVRQGTVTIDVALPDQLPGSARPDLSVDGNVIIERLDDVIFMNRPTFGQANQQISLFKLVEGGDYAQRVVVRLGASSVNEIEVMEGVAPGDVVILSDMSQWDSFDRVRLR